MFRILPPTFSYQIPLISLMQIVWRWLRVTFPLSILCVGDITSGKKRRFRLSPPLYIGCRNYHFAPKNLRRFRLSAQPFVGCWNYHIKPKKLAVVSNGSPFLAKGFAYRGKLRRWFRKQTVYAPGRFPSRLSDFLTRKAPRWRKTKQVGGFFLIKSKLMVSLPNPRPIKYQTKSAVPV